jgi:hypothetical protein
LILRPPSASRYRPPSNASEHIDSMYHEPN